MNEKNSVYFALTGISILLMGHSVKSAQISISGINKVTLIKALYCSAKARKTPGPIPLIEISDTEAERLIGVQIDYLYGRAMKILIPKDETLVESRWYDRDNGENAVLNVVNKISRDLTSSSSADFTTSGDANAIRVRVVDGYYKGMDFDVVSSAAKRFNIANIWDLPFNDSRRALHPSLEQFSFEIISDIRISGFGFIGKLKDANSLIIISESWIDPEDLYKLVTFR